MSALTLFDMRTQALSEGQMLTAGVIDILRKEGGEILEKMKFANHPHESVTAYRVTTLPAPQNRKLNPSSGYTADKGAVSPIEERPKIYGGQVDLDRLYGKMAPDRIIGDPMRFHVSLFTKSIAYKIKYDFLRGDPTSNPDGLTGLWYRLENDTELQGQRINAGGIDISPDASNLDAAFNSLIDGIEELIAAVDEGPDMLVMNKTTLLRIRSGLRQLGLLRSDRDAFGRVIDRWGESGPVLVDAGRTYDQTTLVLPNTENGTAMTGGTKTSIWAVRFGEDAVAAFQVAPLETITIAQTDTGLTSRVVIDWALGMAVVHPRSVARLYNIQAA